MSRFRATFDALFNWKQNPASVFVFVVPLALVGFGCMGAVAYLKWKMTGDLVYTGIFLAGICLLGLALLPAYRIHRRLTAAR
ncbi:hypothetical protein WL29_20415 [Burkholderia ubonensis]|uniref:DUF4175 domain-containing protein n=1 Tax=Burkholderia ubonensis TaxID=101571 RepID=A0A106QCF9_9BURK|nr:hypothetical protein [Burkholderia ubonensis]KWA83733.1 hypothetical protein WL29_20415 [Burkholderia ubonensis]